MRKIQLNKTTKQRNEITVRNIIATNKVKGRNSRLDIDKNVRLERKEHLLHETLKQRSILRKIKETAHKTLMLQTVKPQACKGYFFWMGESR